MAGFGKLQKRLKQRLTPRPSAASLSSSQASFPKAPSSSNLSNAQIPLAPIELTGLPTSIASSHNSSLIAHSYNNGPDAGSPSNDTSLSSNLHLEALSLSGQARSQELLGSPVFKAQLQASAELSSGSPPLQALDVDIARSEGIHLPGPQPTASATANFPSITLSEEGVGPSHVSGAGDLHSTLSTPQAILQNTALKVAYDEIAEDLSPAEQTAFLAYKDKPLQETFDTITRVEKSDSVTKVRTAARSLEPALRILDTCMRSVSISIQHSPEISSLVVGGVRFIIDVIAKFVQFYSSLSAMISTLVDYLPIFDLYSKSVQDGSVVHKSLVKLYRSFLLFCTKARLVFLNNDGTEKRFSHFRTFARVQWQPFEDSFGEIQSKLAHGLEKLSAATGAQVLCNQNEYSQKIDRMVEALEKEREKMLSKGEKDAKRNFLTWISDVDYEEMFNAKIKMRHPGTGEWILEHFEFQSWIDKPTSSLLWCYGLPGSGKSILASVAIDDLTRYEVASSDTCVIFAYYSYLYPERHQLSRLLSSFIKQLGSKLNKIPENTLHFYEKNYGNGKSSASISEADLENQFFLLVNEFKKVYIVIDALDECQRENQDLRDEVLRFVTDLPKNEKIRAFITSRKDEDINDAFERSPMFAIDSALVNADIKIYLRDEIDNRINAKKLKLQVANFKYHILEVLSSKASGMFLWAKLQLDEICKYKRDQDIRRALTCLPRDLTATYDRMLETIMKKPGELQGLARKAIMWTLYAIRPLRMGELQEAVAIDSDTTTMDHLHHNAYDKEVIIQSTENFLANGTGREHGIISPIHYSVAEYFQNKAHFDSRLDLSSYYMDPEISNAEIASSCILYMLLDEFKSGCCNGAFKLEVRTYLWRLAAYATYIFDQHLKRLRSLSPQLLVQLGHFSKSDNSVFSAILQLRNMGGHNEEEKYIDPGEVNVSTMIHSTYLYDILEINKIEYPWASLPPPRFTLHQAARYGQTSAVSRLLASQPDLDINEKDSEDKSPLYHAAENAHCDVARILLDKSALVDHTGRDGATPLMTACKSGHIAVAELLLNHKASVYLQNARAETALDLACRMSHFNIVKLLVRRGAEVTTRGVKYASGESEDDAILEFLLQIPIGRIDVEALEAASIFGRLTRCEWLLDRDVPVSEEALVLACGNYCVDDKVLDLLIARGGIPTQKVLDQACDWGYYTRCKKLLNEGVAISKNALILACGESCGSDDIFDLLIERGASVTSMAIEEACNYGWHSRCIKLLDLDVEITPQALVNACGLECEDDSVLDLLLERATINIATSKALEQACEYGWRSRCVKLLDLGVQTTAKALACGWFKKGKEHGISKILLGKSEAGGVTQELIKEAETLLANWERDKFSGWGVEIILRK